MASSNWAHLIATSRKTSKELLKLVESEIEYQDMIEEQGYRSPTGKVLSVLQNIHGAKTLHGESAAAVQPKFQGAQGAQRGGTVLRYGGRLKKLKWSYGTVLKRKTKHGVEKTWFQTPSGVCIVQS